MSRQGFSRAKIRDELFRPPNGCKEKLSNNTYIRSRAFCLPYPKLFLFIMSRQNLRRVLTASLSLGIALGLPAKADPPAAPNIPVFCFRFTDVSQTSPGSNNFRFEFEILNWTSQNANKLEVYFPVSGTLTSSGKSSLNEGVIVSKAFIDPDGRKLPPNPAITIPGNVGNNPVGSGATLNNWTALFQDIPDGVFKAKKATYDAGTPIPNIDLTKIVSTAGQSLSQAIARVNSPGPGDGSGDFPNNDFNPSSDPETIDNGTNVLDGFAFEVQSFDTGDWLIYRWALGPDTSNQAGSGIGILARDININATFFNSISGITSTGFTSSNPALFAPGSPLVGSDPLVGSEYGFSGGIAAGVTLDDVNEVEVPGPLPVMGAAVAFRYARRIRHKLTLLKTNSNKNPS
jgi:hypothetical protein